MAYRSGVTKLAGFAVMATRWNSHFKRHKSTRERMMKQADLGITEKTMKQVISIDDLIEKACAFYDGCDVF
ncbi:hypothetical protein PHMEG_00020793 [Phytophthora megakarya]|uniref:Uncharacterized protein n=1 Tax=Phytophthora megakarya TaxID=4795 RepID=A0A225VPD7_9STRA|nr:hypothetical protein PHMEG_00020793 [Phytophthora megakarya]